MNADTDPRLHANLLPIFEKFGLSEPSSLPFDDPQNAPRDEVGNWIKEGNQGFQGFSDMLVQEYPLPEPKTEVVYETKEIPGPDGNSITLHIYRPAQTQPHDSKLPAAIYFHGGAMVYIDLSWKSPQRYMKNLAAHGSLIVIGVNFRNAYTWNEEKGPEWNPFPASLNDCTTSIQWIHSHKEELGISKLVLTGESGGGNLAIASSLKANREGWINKIDGVFAVVPYISGVYVHPEWPKERLIKEGLASLDEFGLGYGSDLAPCAVCVKVYDPTSQNSTNPLAWPFFATEADLKGLPPYVIVVSELDPLRDEGVEFYRKLLRAGVSAVGRVRLGLTHAVEQLFAGAVPDEYFGVVRDIGSFAHGL